MKLLLQMALKKLITNFRLEYSRTAFSDIPLFQEIFRWEEPKCRAPFTLEPDFPENFCKW